VELTTSELRSIVPDDVPLAYLFTMIRWASCRTCRRSMASPSSSYTFADEPLSAWQTSIKYGRAEEHRVRPGRPRRANARPGGRLWDSRSSLGGTEGHETGRRRPPDSRTTPRNSRRESVKGVWRGFGPTYSASSEEEGTSFDLESGMATTSREGHGPERSTRRFQARSRWISPPFRGTRGPCPRPCPCPPRSSAPGPWAVARA